MARTIRDASLDTRTARSRLQPSGKPYYRSLEHGLHLGYRKPRSGPGKWVARHYIGKQSYEVEVIAAADDFSDADGIEILDYRQAQQKARERREARARANKGNSGRPLTVRVAMQEYSDFLESNRKSAGTARYSLNAFIIPLLGDFEVEALTTAQLRSWHGDLAKTPARQRTKQGAQQNYRKMDEDWQRRRRSTANRILRILKGGLNRAWRDGKISSDAAWRRVEPFEGVESARVRYLSISEAQRLINAADHDFRSLVEGALQTGARYGELIRFTVSDFNRDAGTVAVHVSKSGKPRHIILTEEGIELFRSLCVGRAGNDPIFTRANGTAWIRSAQTIPMKEASEHAKISPAINFHCLRHTWASHAVMNAVPLMVVAKNLGHADTKMVEQHYGHLAPSYVADAIRAGAPRFGAPKRQSFVGIK
ncbi:site-specific integrase [Bradyrhizobium sp. JYMT SZCCT0428]|uniref:tyrosine-type recombinase/integrase n=1 Tax=Bradyrhizobium sp. JYMT SZCCT0428 TaxID=2807673 RepID=UPI001BA6B493|nr:site-specific integrase [Bradyrhizobium sp. JYMT SZCCT0428]MBR1156665.1 site-specific integrase [Bradyrhizobium sp. JYMT SZCCT0428]